MKKGNWCPLIGKKCVENKCSWYILIRGTHPQTGEELDEWGCAVSWMPTLAIEIAQKSNQTGAAVESFRNEMVHENQKNQKLYVSALEQGIVPAQITPLNPPMIQGDQ